MTIRLLTIAKSILLCLYVNAFALPAAAETYKMRTEIAPGVATPDTLETTIGTLKLNDGFPTKETQAKIWDNLDRSRALQAFSAANEQWKERQLQPLVKDLLERERQQHWEKVDTRITRESAETLLLRVKYNEHTGFSGLSLPEIYGVAVRLPGGGAMPLRCLLGWTVNQVLARALDGWLAPLREAERLAHAEGRGPGPTERLHEASASVRTISKAPERQRPASPDRPSSSLSTAASLSTLVRTRSCSCDTVIPTPPRRIASGPRSSSCSRVEAFMRCAPGHRTGPHCNASCHQAMAIRST